MEKLALLFHGLNNRPQVGSEYFRLKLADRGYFPLQVDLTRSFHLEKRLKQISAQIPQNENVKELLVIANSSGCLDALLFFLQTPEGRHWADKLKIHFFFFSPPFILKAYQAFWLKIFSKLAFSLPLPSFAPICLKDKLFCGTKEYAYIWQALETLKNSALEGLSKSSFEFCSDPRDIMMDAEASWNFAQKHLGVDRWHKVSISAFHHHAVLHPSSLGEDWEDRLLISLTS